MVKLNEVVFYKPDGQMFYVAEEWENEVVYVAPTDKTSLGFPVNTKHIWDYFSRAKSKAEFIYTFLKFGEASNNPEKYEMFGCTKKEYAGFLNCVSERSESDWLIFADYLEDMDEREASEAIRLHFQKPTRTLNAIQLARILKKCLKEVFPGVEFYVRSERHNRYVYVHCTNSEITKEAIRKAIRPFEVGAKPLRCVDKDTIIWRGEKHKTDVGLIFITHGLPADVVKKQRK